MYKAVQQTNWKRLIRSILFMIFCMTCAGIQADEEESEYLAKSRTKDGEETRKVFEPVISKTLKSIIQIQSGEGHKILGTIIDEDGLAITKASELQQNITVLLSDGQEKKADVVFTDKNEDVSLIRIEGQGYTPVKWSQDKVLVGQWVAIPGLQKTPLAIGIVSGGLRRIPADRGVFGVSLKLIDSHLVVTKVFPGTGAYEAKLKKDDILDTIEGKKLKSRQDFMRSLFKFRPGDWVNVGLIRDDKEQTIPVQMGYSTGNIFTRMNFQNQMGGYLSTRRSGFPSIFSHDAILASDQCGGVLVNLEGEAIGLNIARAGRTETYALPVDVILKVIENYRNSLN